MGLEGRRYAQVKSSGDENVRVHGKSQNERATNKNEAMRDSIQVEDIEEVMERKTEIVRLCDDREEKKAK